MDYIRQELLRQKNALATLMGIADQQNPAAEQEKAAQGQRPYTSAKNESLRRIPAAVELKDPMENSLCKGDDLRQPLSWRTAKASWEDRDLLRMPIVHAERFEGTVEYRGHDAKALSRVFQRDARRYDGGFVE